ncbi:MAG: radical SAM protein [Bacteroidetes bacterium]|nr:radical SAM protein [Bacteroidota bacterium]MBU1423475.1 radical SAM protein [Bacteroidota bacterium]
MILFGPIPSRRLGRSLGINNIPPKTCSYSCIYCQIGLTNNMTISRTPFFTPDEIYNEAEVKINKLERANEKIDYLTFVPDGEPTLDINLGKTIEKLKAFGIRTAVITNSSLNWDPEVKNDLMKADWVSLKIDSVYKNVWRNINRPHGTLDLHKIIEGIVDFSSVYKGTLVTETMLVKGTNDSIESLNKTSELIKNIQPKKAYILVPTRPPAEAYVKAPDESILNAAYQIFDSIIGNTELLVYSEGTYFTFTDSAENELLSILAVHPMSKNAVEEFLSISGSTWNLISNLIEKNVLRVVEYSGNTYFIKKYTNK